MLLELKQLTQEEFMALENSKQCRELLSPKQRFENYLTSCQKRGKKLRKHHFKVIISGGQLYAFNNKGKEICTYENSPAGEKKARATCFDLFMASQDRNGSFLWLSPNNWEYQNAEELEIQQQRIAREIHQEKEGD